MKMYLLDQNIIQQNGEVSIIKKVILDLLLNKSNNFEWKISLFFSRRQEIIITYGID